jgi:hypothetical protein
VAVTPADIATELGRSAPADGTPTFTQWTLWIADTLMLIEARFKDRFDQIDDAVLDYVVRKVVAAQARQPQDGASSTTVAVDDSTVTRRYENAVSETDLEDWWDLLEPGGDGVSPGAFTIKPAPQPKRVCWW